MDVGSDVHLSGPAFSGALIRGLVSTGLDLVDLGAVTTSVLYYVAATCGLKGCQSQRLEQQRTFGVARVVASVLGHFARHSRPDAGRRVAVALLKEGALEALFDCGS